MEIRAARRSGGLVWPLLFAAAIAAAWFMMTNHAQSRGTGDLWSASRVLTTIADAARDPNKSPCQRLVVAACRNAVNHDSTSPNYGQLSPQVRVFCQLKPDGGIMGVWGWSNRAGITGYWLQYSRFEAITRRDGCAEVDLTWFQGFLAGW